MNMTLEPRNGRGLPVEGCTLVRPLKQELGSYRHKSETTLLVRVSSLCTGRVWASMTSHSRLCASHPYVRGEFGSQMTVMTKAEKGGSKWEKEIVPRPHT